MAKILLDYVFPISTILPTPAASTAFLKQACLVCKPKAGQEGNVGTVYECTTMTQVGVRTDNTNAQQLFNAGMSRVFILLASDLDLVTALEENANSFFTLLVSDDFDDEDIDDTEGDAAVAASLEKQDITYTAKVAGLAGNDLSIEYLDQVDAGEELARMVGDKVQVLIKSGVSTATQVKTAIDNAVDVSAVVEAEITGTAGDAQTAFAEDDFEGGLDATSVGLQVGTFDGVIGISTQDQAFAAAQAVKTRRSAFFSDVSNKAKNMCFAFGTLLSNQVNWLNQQYIEMPLNDGVDTLGEAESLFDDKVSFILNDDEFSNRLALFAAGSKAIVAPYILKNLMIDLQSAALSWIAGNQPQFTLKNAALLETRLQEDVINEDYIQRSWITAGVVEIGLVEDNFVATGEIDVAEPKALWRVFSELRATL